MAMGCIWHLSTSCQVHVGSCGHVPSYQAPRPSFPEAPRPVMLIRRLPLEGTGDPRYPRYLTLTMNFLKCFQYKVKRDQLAEYYNNDTKDARNKPWKWHHIHILKFYLPQNFILNICNQSNFVTKKQLFKWKEMTAATLGHSETIQCTWISPDTITKIIGGRGGGGLVQVFSKKNYNVSSNMTTTKPSWLTTKELQGNHAWKQKRGDYISNLFIANPIVTNVLFGNKNYKIIHRFSKKYV
jgi:hypothetical protein